MISKKHEYLSYVALHPLEGFDELQYYKAGSVPLSVGILTVWFVAKIIERQATGFIHNLNEPEKLNVLYIFAQTAVLFAIWCIANWAFCTLMDGKGTFKYIWISCSYALVPMIICMLIATLASNFITKDEQIFLFLLTKLGSIWTIWLVFCALKSIHDYSPGKTVLSVLLTLFGIGFIFFVLVLSFSLYKQVYDLFMEIYNEIMFRL